MRSPSCFVCVVGILLVGAASVGADDAGGGSKAPRFRHAALAAYPNAVVSARDPRTGMTFYLESDGRKLVALDRDGALAWGLDVLTEAGVTPAVGQPVVRHLKLDGGVLWATVGKHDHVRIDVATGKAMYAGAD